MSPVISKRTARALLDLCRDAPTFAGPAVVAELRKALETKRSVRASRSRKETKRATKKRVRAEVRLAVMERANGSCEHCRADALLSGLELDHAFGRARSESVETCWALCRYCHREKTNNKPGAAFWLQEFADHCQKFGYSAAATQARRRLGFIEGRAALSRGVANV